MEKLSENKYPLVRQEANKKIILPGYPTYPAGEDIYEQAKQEMEIDPEEISKLKEDNNEDTLDIPGSELDNAQEEIGSEDEENNYYSLGGDNHDNLEEDSSH
ncbi:MAG: hypothetical protein PHR83_16875 [Paludibacter sp.]|nr:hypothetical protein [Paludibacter sp.]